MTKFHPYFTAIIINWILLNSCHAFSNLKCSAENNVNLEISQDNKQDIIHIPWLIVGGGIHGVHIAVRLIGEKGIDPKHVCIVDENEYLLQKWKTRTASTGMDFLRSSAGFHLDVDENSLCQKFHGKQNKKRIILKDLLYQKRI